MKVKDTVGGVMTCALALALFTACSKKTASSSAQMGATPDASGQTSMHGEPARDYYIPEADQRRWQYSSMPNPAPASQPNYLLKSVGFTQGSSGIDNEAAAAVRALAADMKTRPSMAVVVVGFADNGPEKANAENLGMQRAQAIRQLLLNEGVAKDRIETASFGATQSRAPASDKIAIEKERLGEIWLLRE